MIWLITFSGVLILSVEYGIYLGIICSLLLLIYKSQRTEVYLLGSVEDMDIYVPINKYHNVCEKEGFKIFQMCGPLNFSNVDYFSTQLEDKCNINYRYEHGWSLTGVGNENHVRKGLVSKVYEKFKSQFI